MERQHYGRGDGVSNRKMVLVRQDTYVFGKGIWGGGRQVPEKYFQIAR